MRMKQLLTGVFCIMFLGISVGRVCADDVTIIVIEDNSRAPRRPSSSLRRPYTPTPSLRRPPLSSPYRGGSSGGTVGIIVLEEATPLLKATRAGSKKRVEELLNDGAGINEKSRSGITALMEAAKGEPEIMKLLLDKGADVSISDDDGDTALHFAAMYLDPSSRAVKIQVEICKLLADAGVNLDAQNEAGETPLMKAAFVNREVCKFLLTKNVDVNLRNKRGETALHLVVNSSPELVGLMLGKGADVNAKTEMGDTPLLRAVSNPLCKLESVEMLLDAGADVNLAGIEGKLTPLAASFISGHADVCKLLLAKGADITQTGEGGVPPIFLAVEFGTPEILEFFSDQDVDWKQKNGIGETLMFSAARAGNIEMCQTLLDKGVPATTVSAQQKTAAVEAIMNNHLDVAKFLIEKGAKIPKHNSALFAQAVKSGNLEMCKFLVSQKVRAVDDAGSREKLLHAAVETGDPEMCRYVLEFNKNINVSDFMEKTAIHLAVKNLDYEICDLLIKRGASVDSKGRLGSTALTDLVQSSIALNPEKAVKTLRIVQLLLDAGASMSPREDTRPSSRSVKEIIKRRNSQDFIAKHFQLILGQFDESDPPSGLLVSAFKGDLKEMQRWLDDGADINRKDKSGETALHFAIRGGQTDVCKFLLLKGADPDAPGIFNGTPLHYAAAYGRTEIIPLLLKKKADVNAPDKRNKATPLIWAIYASQAPCVELLMKAGADTELDAEQPSPFRVALEMNQAALCKTLCENGVDVNEELRRVGFMPGSSLLAKPFTVSQLKILKDCGMDFALTDYKGNTVLHQLIAGREWNAALFAMDNGADITARNDVGKTAIEVSFTTIIPVKVRSRILAAMESETKADAVPKKKPATTAAKKKPTTAKK